MQWAAAVGINTHFNYLGTVYDRQFAAMKAKLIELGVRHICDHCGSAAVIAQRYRELATLPKAIRLLLCDLNGQTEIAWVTTLNGAVEAADPRNECDNNLGGGDEAIWHGLYASEIRNMRNSYEGDPVTAALPFLGPSFADAGDFAAQLDAVFPDSAAQMDIGHLHPYSGGNHPEGPQGGGWGVSLASAISAIRR